MKHLLAAGIALVPLVVHAQSAPSSSDQLAARQGDMEI
jgi:hypothetical protein